MATEVNLTIPLVDLKTQCQALRPEIEAALGRVLTSCGFILGEETAKFEQAFATYTGTKHCIGLNSGTSALHLALLAAGVGPGDEVLTVPMTFVATCWGISYVGATPVFVDVDPVTRTMDVEQVKRRITPRTKALLPVHLYGQCADLGPLMEIANQHGIPLIEDAAQAHGAKYHGKHAGSFGQTGCFSFYPGKNLGAYGEGGALVTNSDSIALRARALRDHAQTTRYYHEEIGFNYRMDGFQGAVLGVKLKYLEQWTESRRRLAARYQQMLAGLPIELPTEAPERRHVWHLLVVLHPERDRIKKELEARGIHAGLHYPVPVHLQKAYRHLGYSAGAFPVSERIGRECLTLPLYPEMTDAQQDQVVQAMREILR
jgi:dTDP-4-amino-4,6-dideoxygalactose transaminase